MRPVVLIGGNGDSIDLCAADSYVQTGAVFGTTRPAISYRSTVGGRRVQQINRDIVRSVLTITVRATATVTVDEARERVVDALRATFNPLALIVERDDGSRRVQRGYDVGGDPSQTDSQTKVASIGCVVESAVAPWWEALESEIVETVIGVAASTPWVGQMPIDQAVTMAWAWSLSGYYIEDADEQTLNLANPGSLPTWPEWTVTGPATSVEIANERTGKVFNWAGSLITGETLTVRTDPKSRAVVEGTASRWSEVSAASELSELLPGANQVQVRLAGGTDPDTTVAAEWFARFTSP